MSRPDLTEEEFEARLAAGRPDITEAEFDARLAAGRPDISEAEFEARLAAGGPKKDWRGWEDGDRPADRVASNEEPPVTWGEGIQSWGKMMDPGAGIKSLNLLTGTQTLEQQTPTARELDSSNALVGPAAVGVATGLLAGPAQVGFGPAILASNLAGGGARTAYNMAALDQPVGEALKNAATDPMGVGIDTLAGGIGGYTPFLRGATRATGNVSNQIRKLLPGNKHFKGADLMSAHPEKSAKLQESDIVMPQTPEQAAASRVTDEGIAPLTGTDGSVLPNEASNLAPRRSAPAVPEIERAVAVREGLEDAAKTDPRQELVARREAAENKVGAAKAALLARKSQLNTAGASSFDDQIDMLNQADDIPQLGGGRTTDQLEGLVEQAQAELDEVMSVDAYGNPVKLNDSGANVREIAAEAAAAREAYNSGKSGAKGFLSHSWDILTGKDRILGGLTAPNENMRKLVKQLDEKLADPKLTGAKRQEVQAQRDVANATRQNIHANETIRKRVIGEFQVKFGKGLDEIEAGDLVDTVGPKGEALPSNIFRALDGDEKAYKALSEKSKKGFEELRLTMDEFYEAEVRSGLTQSIEPDVIANLRADDDYWQDLLRRKERVGFDIVPPNLTPEQAIELSKAGKLSSGKFKEVAEGLGFKVDPDAKGNKLLVPLLKKQSYVQHRALPMSPKAAANRDAFLRLKYPHKSPSEIDTMVNAGGDRPILMSQRQSEDLTGLNTDIFDVIDGMTNSGAENIANAATWGGLQSKGVQAAMGDTGGNIKQLPMSAVKVLETLPDGPKKESVRRMFTRKYNLEVNPQSSFKRSLIRAVGGSQLTYAGLTSGSELHKAVSMMGGVRSIPFGRAYVKAKGHENVNELWKQSGAAQSPIYDQITGVTQREIRKATESGFLDPLEGMQKAENFLREQGSYGNLWYIDDIARRAADQAAAGKKFSGRILQEASEVFPTAASPEAAAKRLADEYAATGGNMSQELFKEGISELTQGQFYTTALGFIGDDLKGSSGAILLQYRPFMLQAQKMFNQRVMAPFFRGLATGDPGLVALGAGRAMKMAPTAAATASVSATLRSIATGRHDKFGYGSEEASAKDIERRTNDLFWGGVMGFEGDLVRGGKELVVDGDRTRLTDMAGVPALSQGKSIWDAATELLESGASEEDIKWSKVVNGVGNLVSMAKPQANIFVNPFVEKLKADEEKDRARNQLLQRRR